jgi:hypothetical protein
MLCFLELQRTRMIQAAGLSPWRPHGLIRHRNNRDLDAPDRSLETRNRGVVGDRVIRARTHRLQALCGHTAAGQVGLHAVRPLLRQRHVVVVATGAVGVAGYLHDRLVVVHERRCDLVEHRVELRVEFGAVGGESHPARHIEREVIAPADHLDACAGHLLAERRFLLVHVAADRAARQRAHARTDQRALPAGRDQQADDRATGRTDAHALARLLLLGILGEILHRRAAA